MHCLCLQSKSKSESQSPKRWPNFEHYTVGYSLRLVALAATACCLSNLLLIAEEACSGSQFSVLFVFLLLWPGCCFVGGSGCWYLKLIYFHTAPGQLAPLLTRSLVCHTASKLTSVFHSVWVTKQCCVQRHCTSATVALRGGQSGRSKVCRLPWRARKCRHVSCDSRSHAVSECAGFGFVQRLLLQAVQR